jgi:hypothetical protein
MCTRASLALLWFSAAAAAAAAAAQSQTPSSEPLPITLSAAPSLAWIGQAVTLSGSSVVTPSTASVTMTIRAPAGSNPAITTLHVVLGGDGSFRNTYTPRIAGTYQIEAETADGRGKATAGFRAEDPIALSPDTAQALATLAADADQILIAAKQKIDAVPPSPAKDDAISQLSAIEQQTQALRPILAAAGQAVNKVIKDTAELPMNEPLSAARDGLLLELQLVQAGHEQSQQQLRNLTQADVVCDNLEVVIEGIKWTSVLLNFASGQFADTATNFLQDLLGSLTEKGVQSASSNDGAAFGASEAVKAADVIGTESAIGSVSRLRFSAGTVVGALNDFVGKKAELTMAQYCIQFSGPVKAHMHARFLHDGIVWWEYAFDLIGQLTLHYPRDASGDNIALKGRLEGFGNNFSLRENALTVLFPDVMSSTVQKRFVIMPPALGKASGTLGSQYSTEGSVFGGLVTPNSFFFQVTGSASKDKLSLNIGAARTDMDAKARVIAIMASVLTLGMPDFDVYTLPYKPAHFVFERTANNYDIPLAVHGNLISGQQHFENKVGGAEAQGEYSVDIKACNPGC